MVNCKNKLWHSESYVLVMAKLGKQYFKNVKFISSLFPETQKTQYNKYHFEKYTEHTLYLFICQCEAFVTNLLRSIG